MKKKLFLFWLFLSVLGVIAAMSPAFPLLNAFLQSNMNGNGYLGTNFGGFSIKSNTLASIPVLSVGDNFLWSSNGVPYVIASDPSGTLTTNPYNASLSIAQLISATNNALALATNNDTVVRNALNVNVTAATNQLAIANTNLWDPINSALNVTNTARLAINLAGTFDQSGSAQNATNQLAIANTNLWDPINSALNSTNTARLAVNLASTFDALGAAQNATNTARLAINLASSFDASGAAQNATNGLVSANLWDPLGTAQNATNTARLAVNLTGSFDALNAALNATNTARLATQLAATFDALNAALNATNAARLAVNLAASFDVLGAASTATNQLAIANTNLWDTINSALNSTNTARLVVNLASAFDALNAALNSTNGITSAWIQGKFPSVIMTNGGTTAIVYSNGIAIDKAHSLTLSNLTAGALIRAGADNTVVSGDLSGDVTTSGTLAASLKSTGTAGTYYKTTFDGQGRETSGVTTVAMGDIVQPGLILTNNYASGNSGILLSNSVKIDIAHSLSLSNLTASRIVLSGADDSLASAAASGAVPVDADGSTTTAAQINTILAGTSPNINGTEVTNNINSQSVNYALLSTDWLVLLTGAHTATLPTAVGIQGKQFIIKCSSAGTNAILTTSAQTIDGAAKWTNTAINKFTWVVSDNANWRIIGSN